MKSISSIFILSLLVLPRPLAADTLRGTVKDEQGKPISAARVDIATAAPKIGRGMFCPSCYADCKKSARTNEQGEFVIEGVDPKLKFRVLSTAPGKQTRMTELIDPANETAKLVLPDVPEDFPRKRLISGIVLAAGDVPIPGALLDPFGYKSPQVSSFGRVQAHPAVSDDQGRFQMLLDADYDEVFVQVLADGLAGTTLTLKPDQEASIVVPTGTVVTGKLVSEGKPAAGVEVAVVQTNRRSGTHFIKSVLAITDKLGRFEFRALPSSQQYVLFSPIGLGGGSIHLPSTDSVLSTKTFQARGEGETRDLGSLELKPGLTFSGRIEIPAGKPWPQDLKLSLVRDPAWDVVEVPVEETGRFEMTNLPPETYQVQIVAKGWRPDLARMKFQGLRSNSFGVRLTQSMENVAVPLMADDVTMWDAAAKPAIETHAISPTKDAAIVDESEAKISRFKIQLRDEPVPQDGPKLRVHGTVVTADGARVNGADVALCADVLGTLHAISPLHYGDVLARTTTDANGRFLFSQVPIPPRLVDAISKLTSDQGGARLVVSQKGLALAWAPVSSFEPKPSLQIRMGSGAAVRGKIITDSRQAVSDARVEIIAITPVTKTIRPYQQDSEHLYLSMSEYGHTATTDAHGEFVLPDLPSARIVVVNVTAPGFADQRVAFTTEAENKSSSDTEVLYGQIRTPLLKSGSDVVLTPTANVTVRVLDEDGKAVTEGAVKILEVNRRAGSSSIGLNTQGEATVPIKLSGTYTVTYSSEPLHPRLGWSVTQSFTADGPNEPMEIRLPKPRWLTGHVVSSETGRPIVGAWIRFQQRDPEAMNASAIAISDVHGEFRLPVVPGAIRLAFVQLIHGFHAPRFAQLRAEGLGTDIEIPAAGEIEPVTLKFTPGLVMEGLAVTSDGAPVSNLLVRANSADRESNPFAARTDSEGRFRFAGLPPAAKMIVTAVHQGIAAEACVEAANLTDTDFRREPISLIFKPGVQLIGRVLKDGVPATGVDVSVTRTRPGADPRSRSIIATITDREGRYRVGGFEPGDTYQFEISSRDGWVSLGGPHQNPFPQTIPVNQTTPLELPDAELIRCDQTLAGIVVDPEGNPVADVQLSASFVTGWSNIPHRANGPSPSARTNSNGTFRLEQLPDKPLRLTAYLRPTNPSGTRIAFPAEVYASRNDLNIRLLLDPQLAESVEDLDRR